MKKWENFTKDEIIQFVNESGSYEELATKLGYQSIQNNSPYQEIINMVSKLNIDASHLKLREYYFDYSRFRYGGNIKSATASKALIALRGRKCEQCGIEEWMGKQIVLEMHHKDGNRINNELTNIQLLCPNCHSMTDNWRGRGKKVVKERVFVSDEDLIAALKSSNNIRQALIKVGLSAKGSNYDRAKVLCEEYGIIFPKNYCIDCGKEIRNTSVRCKKCENKLRKKEAIDDLRVTRNELKQLIRTTSFLQIGKRFGVSDNTIRKWCRNLNLPCRSHDIKKMSNEEWENI